MADKKPNVRVIQHNLICGTPVVFGQVWSYGAPHAVDDMLHPEYFRSAYRQLRPGDQIRLVRTEHADLNTDENIAHEIVVADVMESTVNGVVLQVDGKTRSVPKPKTKTPAQQKKADQAAQNKAAAAEYVKGHGEVVPEESGTFAVKVDGEVVASGIETNENAMLIAMGGAPLPAKAA